ncbi:hypothetical protein C5167_005346 [Papaver somniferum]|uniref:Protein TIFY n=2 Tax=Papaver somniferum TaxID=3469 RepID=A0A4Y7JDR2_PAPSO|nr:protein TIFY 6B-like isoform X1 [Papaver somniferum]RZC58041.1 hypothetical protein C5167_005346 [Papaver somniferum]
MERDFLGMKSKETITIADDDAKDNNTNVFMRGSPMQWPFANKGSPTLPQFTNFRNTQEERPQKIVNDPLGSSTFMPMSTSDAFDANQKAYANAVQKNFNLDRQGGNHYAVTSYPSQHVDPYSTHRSNEIRTFSVSNHAIAVAMSNPYFKSQVSTAGHPLATSNLKQQPLGGIPVMSPHHVTAASIAGAPDQRNMSRPAAAPAQLTIFYGGSVNVYDDVSPEKAQAIMFLAGNGDSTTPNVATPRAQSQPPTPKGADVFRGNHSHSTPADVFRGNHSHSTPPCSGLSSPLSVTSQPGSQSVSGCSGADELMAAKSVVTMATPISQAEPSKASSSDGSAGNLRPAAVPQARKASLARFLEKRKDRVITAAPYSTNMSKMSLESSNSQGSNGGAVNPGAASFLNNTNNKEPSWNMVKAKIERLDEGGLQTRS